MHAVCVRMPHTDLYCAVEFVSVTETLICPFRLLSRSRVNLSSSSLWLRHSTVTRIDRALYWRPFTICAIYYVQLLGMWWKLFIVYSHGHMEKAWKVRNLLVYSTKRLGERLEALKETGLKWKYRVVEHPAQLSAHDQPLKYLYCKNSTCF